MPKCEKHNREYHVCGGCVECFKEKRTNFLEHLASREMFDLERHMFAGGDYWEFMRQKHPRLFLSSGEVDPEYKKILGIKTAPEATNAHNR